MPPRFSIDKQEEKCGRLTQLVRLPSDFQVMLCRQSSTATCNYRLIICQMRPDSGLVRRRMIFELDNDSWQEDIEMLLEALAAVRSNEIRHLARQRRGWQKKRL